MDESLKDRALGIFEKDQKQLEGAFDPSSDVRAVGIVSSTTVEESDDGTYKKIVKEENAEDLYYDDTVVGKVENEIKEDAETLQAFCKEFDEKILSFNTQINAKKQELVSLTLEAIGRNCWPGIAYSTTTSSGLIKQTTIGESAIQNFGNDYSIFEDRVAMEIYKKMAGPDVNYGAENPFDPTSIVSLTSANSGFGHENHRDNGRLNSSDDATEIEASDYNVGGGGDGSKEYLSNFQSSTNLGIVRSNISSTASDHQGPRNVGAFRAYAGVGVAPEAVDTSKTGSDGADRCIAIGASITNIISEIQTLRSQRDNAVNITNLNKVKDKKMEKELQNWGAENVREKQKERKTSNVEVISAINNLEVVNSDDSNPIGQAEFTTPGTTTWTAPAGVTLVFVVAVGGGGGGNLYQETAGNVIRNTGGGGGGLGWRNNITVVPGQSYTVVVGSGGAGANGATNTAGGNGGDSYFNSPSTVKGGGGQGANPNGGSGGTFTGDGGGNGGVGGQVTTFAPVGYVVGGGGGAGGYSGDGGKGGVNQGNASENPSGDGQGGGGGGGIQWGGGGVGILGEGASGSGVSGNAGVGKGGSGGNDGDSSGTSSGGLYGGGAGYNRDGGNGAVRIIWGPNRSFPSTNTADQTG